MVDRSTIINPFFRELYDRLAPEIDNRMIALANGSAKRVEGGAETVAEAYADQCGYLRALNEVLTVCMELEHNQHGNRPDTDRQPGGLE